MRWFVFLLIVFLVDCSVKTVLGHSGPFDGECHVEEGSNASVGYKMEINDGHGRLVIIGHGSEYDCRYKGSEDKHIGFNPLIVEEVSIGVSSEGSMVTSISERLFEGCINLKKVTIGSNIKIIKKYAFKDCISLKEIDIPDSVEEIEPYAFRGCVYLEHVSIGKGCETLEQAFADWNSSSIVSSYNHVLRYGTNTPLIEFSKDNPYYHSGPNKEVLSKIAAGVVIAGGIVSTTLSLVDFIGYKILGKECYRFRNIFHISKGTNIYSREECTIEELQYGAFADNLMLESVELEDSVITIGPQVFMNCGKLRSVILSKNLNSIGSEAFRYCSELESIIIPDTVTTIGEQAFKGCSSLKVVTIPDSVKEIGDGAFSRCQSLAEFYVNESSAHFTSDDGVLFDKNKTTLLQFPGGKSGAYTIPDSVSDISYSAFTTCSYLTELDVSEKNDFYSAIDGVLFDKNATTLLRYPDGKNNTEYIVPESVSYIARGAFKENNHLTSVVLGDSVKYIDIQAFKNCGELKEVSFLGETEPIACDRSAFYGCEKLQPIIVSSEYANPTFCGFPVRSADSSSWYSQSNGWNPCPSLLLIFVLFHSLFGWNK